MTARDNKDGEELTTSFCDLLGESLAASERERQEAIDYLCQLSVVRPLHYHFSHTILPRYLLEPENLGAFRQLMTAQSGEEQLVEDLWAETLQDYPDAERCFEAAAINCSWHSIKSCWPDTADYPLLVLTMPRPLAPAESVFACLGLVPRNDFYHKRQWRCFVVDVVAWPGSKPATCLYDFIQVDKDQAALRWQEGGFFLSMGSCWPDIDSVVEQLTSQWDDRYYTL